MAVLVGGGWSMDTSAENRALVGSDTLVHLEAAFDEIAAADRALEEGRSDDAEAHLANASDELAEAEAALSAERGQLRPEDASTFEEAIELGHDAREVREAEHAWTAARQANATALETTTDVSERARILADGESLAEEGKQVADAHEASTERLRSFAGDHRLVAATLSLSVDGAGAERVEHQAEEWALEVETRTVQLAFTHAPDEREAMDEDAEARLDAYAPQRLRTVFASFDEDGDDELDPEEAVAFYRWVEDNVPYRYDDEGASPEDDVAVGDGREGSDYQQSPLETYDERSGDCEDTSLLQLAFYAYWDRTAYLMLTSTTADEDLNHATLIVKVDDPQAYAQPDEPLVSYDLEPGNEHDAEPGSYLVVDNTFSDAYGTISGGVDEGTFELGELETLPEAMQYSDDWGR